MSIHLRLLLMFFGLLLTSCDGWQGTAVYDEEVDTDQTVEVGAASITSQYNTQCGGWQTGNDGCKRKIYQGAARVGPWITCSTKEKGSSVLVKQMRTYAGTASSERLIDESNFDSSNNDNLCWAALYKFSEWTVGTQVPRKVDCKGAAYVFTSDDSDWAYHGGSQIIDPLGPTWPVHPRTDKSNDRFRVEVDLIIKGPVSCMVGADLYDEIDNPIKDPTDPQSDLTKKRNLEVAESSWTGSECGQNITLSSMNSMGLCPVTQTGSSAPVVTTPVVTTPVATCSLSWTQQPYNVTVGSQFPACFTPTSGCGTNFRVDLYLNSGAVIPVVAGSTGLYRSGSAYCFDYTAYSDAIGTDYFRVATMDGAPSSGSAISNTFTVSSVPVVTTPVVTSSKWVYTWTLPAGSQTVTQVDLHGSGDYLYPVCTKYGSFAGGSTITCELDSKQSLFTWSGTSGSTEVVWSSGWETNPSVDCHSNGSLTVSYGGTTYSVGVIPFSGSSPTTCRNTIL
jgi:hypothetical protein